MTRRVSMEAFTTVLEVLGAILVAVACFLAWPPAGIFVAGVECIAFGWLLAPAPPRGDPR